MKGVSINLQAVYSEREWRLLVHPRSQATGTYGRDDSLAPNYPLNQHRRMTEKGFLLVTVENVAGAFAGPWVSEAE
jgi:hypothetical protein